MSKIQEVLQEQDNIRIDKEYWQQKEEEIYTVAQQQKAMYGDSIKSLMNELNNGGAY